MTERKKMDALHYVTPEFVQHAVRLMKAGALRRDPQLNKRLVKRKRKSRAKGATS